ncbi:MAG TPA: alpha/beta hydrolase [Chryseobacterium sp.]
MKDARTQLDEIMAHNNSDIEVNEEKRVFINVHDSDKIELIVIKPNVIPKTVVVFYHSGGWVIGSASNTLSLGKYIATKMESIVVLADYRKAPEYPFPVPVNDAYAALEWIDRNMLDIAGRKLPLIIMGESAGGNLAAVTAIRARDLKGPELAAQILLYPVVSDDLDNETYRNPENQLMLSKRDMMWFWDKYIPNIQERKNPEASPIYTENLTDLPPTIILTAGYDPLCQEGGDYAARLIQAGIPVVFKKFEDQFHGFFSLFDILPASQESFALICNSLDYFLKFNQSNLKL